MGKKGLKKSVDREKELTELILLEKLPSHVAFVMDGNGRWAQKRSLPRIAGHRAGINTLKEIVSCASEIGIKIMTCFAFSTENWKRPRPEVNFLMKLPQEYLQKELRNLMEKNIIIRALGDLQSLPSKTLKSVENSVNATKDNTGMILNFAINYGARSEIINAVKKISSQVKDGSVHEEEITEDLFNSYLYTSDLPDPDLLIRPSGELRLSNFLLWQSAYTELWFSDVLWPDFTREHFLQAMLDYQKRERRYGGI